MWHMCACEITYAINLCERHIYRLYNDHQQHTLSSLVGNACELLVCLQRFGQISGVLNRAK